MLRDTVHNTSFSRGLVKERMPKYAFLELDSSSMVGGCKYS